MAVLVPDRCNDATSTCAGIIILGIIKSASEMHVAPRIVVHCCPLLPMVAHCCPWLPIVAHCYPLLPIVAHCYPSLPIDITFTTFYIISVDKSECEDTKFSTAFGITMLDDRPVSPTNDFSCSVRHWRTDKREMLHDFTPLPNRIKSNEDNWQEVFIQGTKANIVFGWDTSQIWDISQISIKNMTRISRSMISTVLRVFPQVHKLVSVVCTLLILESKWNSGESIIRWKRQFFVCFLITLSLCVSS